MDQNRAPLYERLIAHRDTGAVSFHVPGHKGGAGVDLAGAYDFRRVMELDVTELPGLDDLHDPDGVILEAERLAAACFGAEATYYLIAGSTVGNLAAVLTCCSKPGELLIVQRNVHKSVLHGLMLAGAAAVFLPPAWDADNGVAAGVSPADVERALDLYPRAAGVLVTNPNYYGMGADLRRLADIVHARGVPLLVDEAHGAHYGLHPHLPPSALSCGADAVVQSTHKMLTSMTMTAMLHVQGTRIDRDRLRRMLGMLQSSSPSYPLMASLDLCRRWVSQSAKTAIERALEAAGRLKAHIRDRQAFTLIEKRAGRSPYLTLDPLKLSLREAAGTLSGFALKEELERRGCYPEMADAAHAVLALSPATTERDTRRLAEALNDIAYYTVQHRQAIQEPSAGILFAADAPYSREISGPVAFGVHASQAPEESVPIAGLEGRICAEPVIPYPPGIPVVYPGETVSRDAARHLALLAESGARFQGLREPGRVRVRKRV